MKEKQVKLGHAKQLVLRLDNDEIPIKDMEIDLNALNIFVGANGVGKSLIMKITWVMQMIANAVILKAPLKETAQFVLDKSIPEHNMFGGIAMSFDSGATVGIAIVEGKVTEVDYKGFEEIKEPVRATFMSSGFRRFEDMRYYLSERKNVSETDKGLLTAKLADKFKLYDVMYMERLINRMPLKLDKTTKDSLKGFEIEGIDTIEFTGDDFVALLEDGKRRSLSTFYGSGHQSLINMTIANIL